MSASMSFPINARQAAIEAAEFSRTMNAQRKVPTLPPAIQKLSDETTVHIYNVGPWSHKRELGSIGSFFVPACERGKEYAEAKPIAGVFRERIIIDERTMELRQEPGGGRYIAEQVVGIGAHLSPANSFAQMGVFVGSVVGPGAKPTKKEIEDAKAKLTDYYLSLVEEAKRAYEQGPKEAEATIRDQHRLAARELKLDSEPWMTRSITEARQKCEACGTVNDSKNILCHNCKYIFNPEAYAKLQSRFAK